MCKYSSYSSLSFFTAKGYFWGILIKEITSAVCVFPGVTIRSKTGKEE